MMLRTAKTSTVIRTFIFWLAVAVSLIQGFHVTTPLHPPSFSPPRQLRYHDHHGGFLSAVPRYGPIEEHNYDDRSEESGSSYSTFKKQFRQLVDQVLTVADPQHIPSLLTKQMPTLLSSNQNQLSGPEFVSMVEEIIQEYQNMNADQQAPPIGVEEQEQRQEIVLEAIDLIVSFAQDFVQETEKIDQQNKQLLGKILRTMSPAFLSVDEESSIFSTTTTTSNTQQRRQRQEEALDELLASEQWTPGFLRHLQGECQRLSSSTKITPETTRLLQLLYVLQLRILDEMTNHGNNGQEPSTTTTSLGPAAQVLGQLIGYETKVERMAVLQAGLAVRGVEFAKEMWDLTQEALEGFATRANVDPDLITIVQEINDKLRQFIQSEQDIGLQEDKEVGESGFQ